MTMLLEQPEVSSPVKKQPHRFVKGNKFGKGGLKQGLVEQFRHMLINKDTSYADLRKAWRALIGQAHKGNVQACCEVLDRFFGKNKVLSTGEAEQAMVINILAVLSEPNALASLNGLQMLAVQQPDALPSTIVLEQSYMHSDVSNTPESSAVEQGTPAQDLSKSEAGLPRPPTNPTEIDLSSDDGLE